MRLDQLTLITWNVLLMTALTFAHGDSFVMEEP
jgi:hypothetical protein